MPVIPLEPLNLFIGPNGSGKSNLIEAIALLRSAATDMMDTIGRGGVQEWIWKGKPDATAWLEVVINNPDGSQPLRHHLAFTAQHQMFRLSNEEISDAEAIEAITEGAVPTTYYRLGDAPNPIRSQGGFGGLGAAVPGHSIMQERPYCASCAIL